MSDYESFDLLCERSDAVLRVEVKGTVSSGRRVALTANEVEHARRWFPDVALAVVSGIELEWRGGSPIADGGDRRIIEPWRVDAGRLRRGV